MISLQYDLSLEIKCSRRSIICSNLCKVLFYYVLCNKDLIVYHYEYQIFFKSVVSFDCEGYDFITKPLLNCCVVQHCKLSSVEFGLKLILRNTNFFA